MGYLVRWSLPNIYYNCIYVCLECWIMVIIKVWAGLGNQMFQYALYREFASRGLDVYLDANWYNHFNCFNGFELPQIFPNFKARYASITDCTKMAYTQYTLFQRIKRKLLQPKKTHYIEEHHTNSYSFDSNVLKFEHMYIEGYFQSEKYFSDIREELLDAFRFKVPANFNKSILEIIEKVDSVSVHIRRGDYLKVYESNKLLCNSSYYFKAIDYMLTHVDNPTFFVFSDDIAWCKSLLQNYEHIQYVDGNTKEQSYLDMFLMSKCKHNIVADSSFSWWGAWLNTHAEKIVIAPKNWNIYDSNSSINIIPDTWVSIDYNPLEDR